jgi:hypothetical protein
MLPTLLAWLNCSECPVLGLSNYHRFREIATLSFSVLIFSTLNQKTSFPSTISEERTNSHIHSTRSDVTGPKHGLNLHNGAWTLLKATAISYVPRWRRNKDCSELFSGPRKTKGIHTSQEIEEPNFGFCKARQPWRALLCEEGELWLEYIRSNSCL